MRTQQEIKQTFKKIEHDLAKTTFRAYIVKNAVVIYEGDLLVCTVYLTKDDYNIVLRTDTISNDIYHDVCLTSFSLLIDILYEDIEGGKASNETD